MRDLLEPNDSIREERDLPFGNQRGERSSTGSLKFSIYDACEETLTLDVDARSGSAGQAIDARSGSAQGCGKVWGPPTQSSAKHLRRGYRSSRTEAVNSIGKMC